MSMTLDLIASMFLMLSMLARIAFMAAAWAERASFVIGGVDGLELLTLFAWVTPSLIAAARLAAAACTAAAVLVSPPNPPGTPPPWPTIPAAAAAMTAILFALWSSSTLYCWCRPLLPGEMEVG